MDTPVIVGRSSSHFTRVARIFAIELGVAHAFRPVFDLNALEPSAYAGNPALKIPVLLDEDGPLFGAENVCRALVRRDARGALVVLRGDLTTRIVANAEELTLHVMSAEVSLIMSGAKAQASPHARKLTRSIEESLGYLDAHLDTVLAALPPERALSFVEVALYCVLTHLPFRDVLDVSRWSRLAAFTQRFGLRDSAQATPYRFDAP